MLVSGDWASSPKLPIASSSLLCICSSASPPLVQSVSISATICFRVDGAHQLAMCQLKYVRHEDEEDSRLIHVLGATPLLQIIHAATVGSESAQVRHGHRSVALFTAAAWGDGMGLEHILRSVLEKDAHVRHELQHALLDDPHLILPGAPHVRKEQVEASSAIRVL